MAANRPRAATTARNAASLDGSEDGGNGVVEFNSSKSGSLKKNRIIKII